jgi:soluble lytic murein transglycosylase-like protein
MMGRRSSCRLAVNVLVRIAPIAAAAALLAAGGAHAADLYGFVDETGRVHVTATPPAGDPRYQLFLRAPDDYLLKEPAALPPTRNPGDFRLRSPLARMAPENEKYLLSNPALDAKPYKDEVIEAAREHRVDPALVYAVMRAESNYNPNAVSEKGAVGLMQIMPDTGRRFGLKEKELRVPGKNIRTGVQYLSELIAMFDGDLRLAVAAYNAGENAVIRHGRRVPPYAETIAYVPRVLRLYEELRLK